MRLSYVTSPINWRYCYIEAATPFLSLGLADQSFAYESYNELHKTLKTTAYILFKYFVFIRNSSPYIFHQYFSLKYCTNYLFNFLLLSKTFKFSPKVANLRGNIKYAHFIIIHNFAIIAEPEFHNKENNF